MHANKMVNRVNHKCKCILMGLGFFILLMSCQNIQYHSLPGKPIVLAESNQNCRAEFRQRIWMLGFGVYQINAMDIKAAFAKKNTAWLISEERDWLDYLVTIGGGWLVTLTSKTIQMDSCESQFVVSNKNQIKSSNMQAVVDYSKYKSRPIQIITNDLINHTGLLKEINAREWIIDVLDDTPIEEGNVLDVLHLKNGRTIYGKVIHQSINSVRFRSKLSTKRYLKSSIAKIDFAKSADNMDRYKTIKIPAQSISDVIFN